MIDNLPNNPLILFDAWLTQARESEINDPEAAALATADVDGTPSVRMVLIKAADTEGFKFHTNRDSQKGVEMAENPQAALCFHWKSLRKQVRVQGRVETVSDDESDEYFRTRPYRRKIGAHASAQSRFVESREVLEAAMEKFEKLYPNEENVPRPPYWLGYRLIPATIEFWSDNPDRLHDRFLYTRTEKGAWTIQRLYP